MNLSRSDFRLSGNARSGFLVQQRIGAGWETITGRYATAAEARVEIARILEREAKRG